ncbi:FMN-binding domain protein [Paenibacillus larvae subsp. larvae]|nr:FMN-binding domain protein [Paenibacillus larvae subsp. larvae]AVF30827.1 FMN-binding domain protein [Paenibacillus larvae subsp. larvae]QHZ51269.1 FMN-binding domain protein [Paenibacillus larvae subsp. larvae]
MQAAVDTTIPEIIKKQGTEGVDAVAEATKSSEAVIQGVNQALEKAKK